MLAIVFLSHAPVFAFGQRGFAGMFACEMLQIVVVFRFSTEFAHIPDESGLGFQ